MSVIVAENIKKSFGNVEVLKDISIKVNKGEVVVLMGPSGTGKSTFLRTLNYLEIPDDGKILFDGIEIINNSKVLRKARSKMAFVSQNYNLFPHMSVLKNVTYPLIKIKKMDKNEAVEIATKTLKRVGLGDKLKNYPGQLSGGQKQRVAIARAIAIRPDLILFDEPTSALDPEMTSEVLTVMKELADDGITMIVVTHEINFAKYAADRIVFMDGGIIVEENSPDIFFTKPSTPQALKFLAKLA